MKTTFTTPTDTELVATRTFDAPRQLVWDAHTKPEHVRKWLIGYEGWSMPVCEMDVREGGSFNWRWRRDADGSEFGISGVYREISAPDRIVNTEAMEGFGETLNTTVFTEEDGKTTVTVTVVYPSKESREAAIATGMKDGWNESYDRLEATLLAA